MQQRSLRSVLKVASQATVTTDPRERSFDDPPFKAAPQIQQRPIA